MPLALLLSGCLFQAKPPTELEIEPAGGNAKLDVLAVASPLLNPSGTGEPSPIVLRIYQLKGDAAFASAGFRDLWEKDGKTLGPTLLSKSELYLDPGGVERVVGELAEGTAIIAVTAGYRRFEDAKWRAMVPVQGERHLKLKVELTSLAVKLGPQD